MNLIPNSRKDRVRRQEFLSGVCCVLPVQGTGFAWISQTEASRVSAFLY